MRKKRVEVLLRTPRKCPLCGDKGFKKVKAPTDRVIDYQVNGQRARKSLITVECKGCQRNYRMQEITRPTEAKNELPKQTGTTELSQRNGRSITQANA